RCYCRSCRSFTRVPRLRFDRGIARRGGADKQGLRPRPYTHPHVFPVAMERWSPLDQDSWVYSVARTRRTDRDLIGWVYVVGVLYTSQVFPVSRFLFLESIPVHARFRNFGSRALRDRIRSALRCLPDSRIIPSILILTVQVNGPASGCLTSTVLIYKALSVLAFLTLTVSYWISCSPISPSLLSRSLTSSKVKQKRTLFFRALMAEIPCLAASIRAVTA
ncbi:hypothetical protein B296_00047117, partial [Ensete ventricosum]